MHVFETAVRLQHTDAAGVMFFARLFELAHLAFEDMLESIGHPLPPDLGGADVAYPIVHASADYRAPLRLNDRVRIEVTVRSVRSRAFELGYAFLRGETRTGEATTVHVAVGRGVRDRAVLPEDLASALRALESGHR